VARPFDVVIIDTELGDCTAAEAVRTIAREAAGPSLIALTLSVRLNGLPPDELRSLFAYLTKPFEADQVRFVIDRAIERADLRRRLRFLDRQVRTRKDAVVPREADPPDELQREFALFRRCAKVFAREVRVPALATALAEVLAEEFLAASVAVFLWDAAANRFAPAAAYGLDEKVLADTVFRHGTGIAGRLADTGRVLRRSQVATAFDYDEAIALVSEFDLLRAEIAVPMLRRGGLLGFVSIGPRVSGRPITEMEIEWLVLVAGMAAVAVDNCQARQALALEKLLAERVVAGLDVGVITTDANGTITACNHAATETLDLERSPVGGSVSALGEALAELADSVLRLTELRATRVIEHEGTGRRLRVSAAPIAGDGHRAGVVLVLGPAPERAAEIAPADEVGRGAADEVGRPAVDHTAQMAFWSELAARMAHKLKNPLVSIKTFTQLLPDRYTDEQFRTDFLDVVDGEADKINEIADRLLLYSEAHGVEPVPTDLAALVRTVLDAFAAPAEASGVRIERELDELPVVMADPGRLSLALHSLVENALEAMPGGGRLTLRARLVKAPAVVATGDSRTLDFSAGDAAPAFACVEVADTGGGIAREHLDRVFEPFYSQSVRGLGLGLAIVARVVQQHRGRVEITTTPGRGTQVRILLPAQC